MNPHRGSPSFIVLQRVGVVAVIGELKATSAQHRETC
jgi:hypothetical protein